jgi:hypothetical protein
MAGYSKGTRVGYGDSIGQRKDERSGQLGQPGAAAGAQAKVPVSGKLNDAREKNSKVSISTRKTAV